MTAYPETLPRINPLRLIAPMVRTYKDQSAKFDSGCVELNPVRPIKPLLADDLPLIVVSHDEGHLVPAFLDHYRRLGVTRFLWVDDASSDGTVEMLSAQSDVDLHVSNVRFKVAHRGRQWRQMLVSRYGAERWYLSVDADELLIYRNSDTADLRAVIKSLERQGIRHFAAPMIDMYPPGRVSEARFPSGTKKPWEVANLFDATGYRITPTSRCWKIEGGVRKRAFGSDLQLNKIPLLYWSNRTNLHKSIHAPAPYYRNFGPPLGVLLHFKFFGDFAERFEATVANGQHFLDGGFYGSILSQITDRDSLILEADISAPYGGPEDMYRRGFFSDWRQA